MRLSSVWRLAARISSGSDSTFSMALLVASAKPRPPSPPAFTPQQTVTPATPQLTGGTPFQPINTSHTPMEGYGVYSPEYLQQLELNSEPPVYGPAVPDNFDSSSFDPLYFDPLDQNDVFLPVDNASEQEPVIDEEAVEQAEDLAEEITEGKGLNLFHDSEMNREEVIEQLEAGGYEVESSEWGLAGDNVTRTTITDPETGETIHEYYDHDTDRYWVEVTGEDGETLSQSPLRDDEGRKFTVSEDEESGERTTRLEDDLGDGSVVEITELPGSDVVTITTTDSDGNSETVVVAEDGTQTTLDPEQETTREGIDDIAEDVSEGKSIDQIAEERELTREQVIAQLAAAGYEVEFETDELTNGGEQYTTRIVDAEDGEEVIASYSSGRGIGSSSIYIDAEGNETRRTEYGNGTIVEIVIEPDGRETKTTTVVENDGEASEYEVQDGDYLIAIAERHGVTLEELEESNPELFDSPRDPNVIHVGETVVIENATQTTVEVTDNGYTLTTSPDGSKTLRRDEDGLEIDIEPATHEESLTELLMGLDGDTDEEQALQGILESILLGSEELARIEELEEELEGLEKATQDAIEEILGEEGDAEDTIKPASDAAGDNPGTPPDEAAPSGGEWEAVRRNGVWVWVDAELVEAVEAEEAARRARDEAMTSVLQRQAELDVYALDPEYENAWNNALERLNAAGEAHGVYWELPDPDSSLKEAQERLEEITTWIEYLDAEREWQELQGEAEDIEERLVTLYEEDEEFSRYFDEDGYEYTVSRGRAGSKTEHTGELENQEIIERDGQLYLVNTYENMDEEVEVPLTYAPGDAPRERPDLARGLDREWDELMSGGDSLKLADIKQDALAAEREENPHYFEEGGYEYEVTSRGRGGRSTRDRHTGELMTQNVIERDGQLYLVNTYASEEVEIQLTHAPGESGRTDAQQQVDGNWAHWKRERDASADGLIDVTERYNEAKEDYQEMRAEQFAEQRESLEGENGEIANAQQTLDDAEERLGEGSLVSDDEDTVPIERDGETWYVHPEVAAAHEVLNDAEERLAEYSRLEEAALEAYREQHPERFGDNYRYYDASRDHRGEGRMQSAGRFSENDVTVTVEDGQLHLTIVYENYTLEDELTYTPDEAPEWMERTEAEQQLDRQWADWIVEGSLEEARTAVEEAQTSYDDTVEEYGLGGTEKLTGSLPDDVDPVLVPIIDEEMGEGMRWVHPEVAAAQEELVLLERQRDSLKAGEWHARMEAYRASQPSTWQLLDGGTSAGPAQEGPGPAESWQWENDYLELEGGYLEAQQHLSDSREARILTQLGIIRAGVSFMEKAPEEWKEQHPELDLADELDLLENKAKALLEALDENADHRLNIERASRFNAHLLGQEEAHRLDPDNWPAIATAFRDQEADEARVEAGLDDLPEERVITIDEELDANLSAVLGTDDAELIDPVADQIRELGDKGDEVEIIPILYQESGSTYDTALFRMSEDDTHPWLIDDSGSRYRNFADFQYNNYLSENGQVYVPENFAEIANISGDIQYEWEQAREKSFTEEWLDPVIGIGTSIATLASFIPVLAPVAAPLAVAGGAYFAARSVGNLANMQRHGRSWASTEGLMQGAMLATSVLPMASSGLRLAGMTARGVEGTVAARTSIGAFNANRLNPRHANYSLEYRQASQMLSQPGGVFAAARWSDVGAMGIGTPLLGYSVYNIAAHGGEMSSLERTDAWLGVASGIYGTGMGYRGLRASWPNQRGAREQAPPALPELNRTSTPWSTSGEFSTTTRLYPTAHMRAGSEAIDTAALQASLGAESPTPTTANHPPHVPDSLAGPFPGHMPEAAFPRISRQELAVASTDPQSVARLTSTQFSDFSFFQLARFSLAQMRTVRASQLNALSNDQLAAFTPEQVAALDPQVLGKLAPEKFASLSTRQLSKLTEDQGDALRSWQLERLPSEQRALLPLTTRSFPGEEVSAAYQNIPDTSTKGNTLTKFRDFVWYLVQQNSRLGDEGAVRFDLLIPWLGGSPNSTKSHTSQAIPSTEGRAWLYHPGHARQNHIEAISRAITNGELPAGYHVHIIRSQRKPGEFVLTDGTIPLSGTIQGDGEIVWPARRTGSVENIAVTTNNENQAVIRIESVKSDGSSHAKDVKYNEDVYIVVSELSAGAIRDRFRHDQGRLYIAEYDSDRASGWNVPTRPEATTLDIGKLPGEAIVFIPPSHLAQVDKLSGMLRPEQVPHLTEDQVGALNDAQLESLTDSHIQSLTDDQIRALGGRIRILTADQIGAMSDSQQGAFTHSQWDALLRPQLDRISTSLLQQHATPTALENAARQGTISLVRDGSGNAKVVLVHGIDNGNRKNIDTRPVLGRSSSELFVLQASRLSAYNLAAKKSSAEILNSIPLDDNIHGALLRALSPDARSILSEIDPQNVRVQMVRDPLSPKGTTPQVREANTLSEPKPLGWLSRLVSSMSPSERQGSWAAGISAGLFLGAAELHRHVPLVAEPLNRLDVLAPAMVISSVAAATRGLGIFSDSSYKLKFDSKRERIETGESITGELLNWGVSRIYAARKAFNLNNDSLLAASNATEEFWLGYQLLKNLPTQEGSAQQGWTQSEQAFAIREAANEYQKRLKEAVGEEALFLKALDPRLGAGRAFLGGISLTHLLNVAVSWQFLTSGGVFPHLFSNDSPWLMVADNAGLAGFMIANLTLGMSAAAKLGAGLRNIDPTSSPLRKAWIQSATTNGSYFYGILTPSWAGSATAVMAANALASGNHWLALSYASATIPQVFLGYYGLKGLRDDSIAMRNVWRDVIASKWPNSKAVFAPERSWLSLNRDPDRAWLSPKGRTWLAQHLAGLPVTGLSALTMGESLNQFFSQDGSILLGSTLAAATAMQASFLAYIYGLKFKPLNFHMHGFDWLAEGNRTDWRGRLHTEDTAPLWVANDEQKIWRGVGSTLFLSMAIPAAIESWLRSQRLETEEPVEEEEQEPEQEPAETQPPSPSPDSSPSPEFFPSPEPSSSAESSPSLESTPSPDSSPSPTPASTRQYTYAVAENRRTNPALEGQGHDWVEVESHLSLGSIAISRGHDVAEVVELNLGHIGDPSALQPGDRVYLPKREMA